MSTRIRYTGTSSVLTSKEFLAVNQVVRAVLYPESMEAHILDASDTLVKQLKSNNLQNLKKLVKKTLTELGVNFTTEVRPRFSDPKSDYVEIETILGEKV